MNLCDKMDENDGFIDIDVGQLRNHLEERRSHAKQIYDSLRNTSKQTMEQPMNKLNPTLNQDEDTLNLNQNHEDNTDLDKKGICNKHALIILEGLSEGHNVGKTRKKNPILQQYPMEKLKNVPRVALLKISKIFVSILSKKCIFLTPIQFYEKYLRTNEMLHFFNNHNLNLIPTFQDLLYLRDWQRENNEYLNRGYARDYLPEDIIQILAKLPKVYEDMVFIYDNFGFKLKKKQKRKKATCQPMNISEPNCSTAGGLAQVAACSQTCLDKNRQQQSEQMF